MRGEPAKDDIVFVTKIQDIQRFMRFKETCSFLCAKTQALVDMANQKRDESKAILDRCTAMNEPNRVRVKLK